MLQIYHNETILTGAKCNFHHGVLKKKKVKCHSNRKDVFLYLLHPRTDITYTDTVSSKETYVRKHPSCSTYTRGLSSYPS